MTANLALLHMFHTLNEIKCLCSTFCCNSRPLCIVQKQIIIDSEYTVSLTDPCLTVFVTTVIVRREAFRIAEVFGHLNY